MNAFLIMVTVNNYVLIQMEAFIVPVYQDIVAVFFVLVSKFYSIVYKCHFRY